MMDFENEPRAFDDHQRYDRDHRDHRDRSASPRPARRADSPRGVRTRSASPNGRIDRGPPMDNGPIDDRDPGSRNPGSNLFVTGIHPRLSEMDVSRLFEKYGVVERCAIMVDPHTKESRGFGFVKMDTVDQAEAARDNLQGEIIEGRTLSIERARRARPRTPTPGKYFGPPKRDDFRRPPPGRFDRYDDRRRGGFGGRHDDHYGHRGSGRYDDRDRDRHYGRRDNVRDDYGSRAVDRYASSGRDDRYDSRGGGGGGGDDRRSFYDRDGGRSGHATGNNGGFADASGGRPYDDRADDRYSRR